jgi:hypothetical protein
MNNSYGTSAGGYDSPPDTSSPAPGRKKRLLRWGAGITLAGFLAGGGIAWAATSGSPAAGSSAAGAPTSAQAAVLNSALNTAGAASATVPAGRVRWALGRLRRLGGIDGEFTFHNKTGYHTLAFERGTIQSASGGDVVVKAADGTVWTWEIVSDTVVRQGGKKTTTSALAPGETVFAGGPVVSGARDARLIVLRAAAASGSSGSDSAKTTLS